MIIRSSYQMIHFLSSLKRQVLRILFICFLFMGAISCYAISPYTNEELDELEKEFKKILYQSPAIIQEPLVSQYVNHLSASIAKHHTQPLHLWVIDAPVVNAFAGPGGHIVINSELILNTENEGELAGVIAHEIAHVRLNHLYTTLEHQKKLKAPFLAAMLASTALGLVNPALATGAFMATLSGAQQHQINYIRAHEKQADRVGLEMLMQSHYDPKGMIGFFQKMQRSTQMSAIDDIPAILKTHPLDQERIAEALDRIPLNNKYYASSLNYLFFKESVRVLCRNNTHQLMRYYLSRAKNEKDDAARFGLALTYLKKNKGQQALALIINLLDKYPDDQFLTIALTKAYLSINDLKHAHLIAKDNYELFPDNYAMIINHGAMLTINGLYQQAVHLYLKAMRQFTKDIYLCEALAKNYALNHQNAYAYFTKGSCELLKDNKKNARQKFKYALKIAHKNSQIWFQIQSALSSLDS